MKKLLLAIATLGTLAFTGCETHDHDRHARWEHRDRDAWRGTGGYPEHERVYQPPVTVYKEYPEYRR